MLESCGGVSDQYAALASLVEVKVAVLTPATLLLPVLRRDAVLALPVKARIVELLASVPLDVALLRDAVLAHA